MNKIKITPELLRSVAIIKKVSLTELHRYSGVCSYYTDSYFLKVVRGVKPVSDRFEEICSNLIIEPLSTNELIKVVKLSQII